MKRTKRPSTEARMAAIAAFKVKALQPAERKPVRLAEVVAEQRSELIRELRFRKRRAETLAAERKRNWGVST
jgi:hypothetical protein